MTNSGSLQHIQEFFPLGLPSIDESYMVGCIHPGAICDFGLDYDLEISVEFQLIHEDYQRKKRVSTLYSDHYEVLSNAKRQLSVILAMPVLGMIGVILGFPPQVRLQKILFRFGYL